MNKKLNAITLSGLTIGPILGSGIVFLPQVAYGQLGLNSIYAWIIMHILGIAFAYIITKMSVLTQDNEGLSGSVGYVLGPVYKNLSGNYMTASVLFGPAAVTLVVSDYFQDLLNNSNPQIHGGIAVLMLILCAVIILSGVSSLGGVSLVLSSVCALFLTAGCISVFFKLQTVALPSTLPDPKSLGYTLLLIFWSVIGWEVIGNYIEDIENPTKVMFQSLAISLTAIIFIYVLVVLALQTLKTNINDSLMVDDILINLFGNQSGLIFAILIFGLCLSTIVLFIGAISRQLVTRSLKTTGFSCFDRLPKSVLFLTIANIIVILAFEFGIVNFEWIVSIANVFFISNAVLGLAASFVYLSDPFYKGLTVILMVMLVMLLFFASPLSLMSLVFVTIATIVIDRTVVFDV